VVGPDHRLVLGLHQFGGDAHLPRVPAQAALNHEASGIAGIGRVARRRRGQ